jgi:hypothetical protein
VVHLSDETCSSWLDLATAVRLVAAFSGNGFVVLRNIWLDKRIASWSSSDAALSPPPPVLLFKEIKAGTVEA